MAGDRDPRYPSRRFQRRRRPQPGLASSKRSRQPAKSAATSLAVDWAATPLGPPEPWPRACGTIVRVLRRLALLDVDGVGPGADVLLQRRLPPRHARHEVPVGARPRRRARCGRRSGPTSARGSRPCCAPATATWDEALLLFLERSGYAEETYHTFSYSPLTDDDGAIAGMLCVVSEDTERVIGERRMATLRDLGSGPRRPSATTSSICAPPRGTSSADRRSLPFTLTYLFDEDGPSAELAGSDRHPGRPPGGSARASRSADPDPAVADRRRSQRATGPRRGA